MRGAAARSPTPESVDETIARTGPGSLAILRDLRRVPPVVEAPSFEEQLRNLPVTINGLADPAILKDSTAEKLETLIRDRHVGPVAIVTKGDLSTPWWRERLKRWCAELDLFVFASISGLPRSFEPISIEPRFRTLRAARDAGAKAIAYLRPIVPGVNDSIELLTGLMRRSADSGCHAVVSSGFRGNAPIVGDSGFAESGFGEENGWLPSVKLHKGDTETLLREFAGRSGISFWTGTACAVAALRGADHSLAPYHLAPHFARCDECSLRESCSGRAHERGPRPGSLELLRHLGYQAELHPGGGSPRSCEVRDRPDCSLHCTNCPRAPGDYDVPHVSVRLWDGGVPSWGDLCLARFLTGGMLCTHPLLSDKEESTITIHPRFGLPNRGGGSLYATTSWMMWSEYLPKERCFRCSYCFVGMYKDRLPEPMQGTVGMSPVGILRRERC